MKHTWPTYISHFEVCVVLQFHYISWYSENLWENTVYMQTQLGLSCGCRHSKNLKSCCRNCRSRLFFKTLPPSLSLLTQCETLEETSMRPYSTLQHEKSLQWDSWNDVIEFISWKFGILVKFTANLPLVGNFGIGVKT